MFWLLSFAQIFPARWPPSSNFFQLRSNGFQIRHLLCTMRWAIFAIQFLWVFINCTFSVVALHLVSLWRNQLWVDSKFSVICRMRLKSRIETPLIERGSQWYSQFLFRVELKFFERTVQLSGNSYVRKGLWMHVRFRLPVQSLCRSLKLWIFWYR